MPSNKTSDVSNFQKAILRCDCTSGQFGCSVTRFVEISPLRQQKLSLWQFLEFSLWQSFEPTLANFYAIGQFFIIVNSQILKNDLAIWSHWLQTFIIFLLQKFQLTSVPLAWVRLWRRDRDAIHNSGKWPRFESVPASLQSKADFHQL